MGRKRIRSQDYFVSDSETSKRPFMWRNIPEDHMLFRFATEGKAGMRLLRGLPDCLEGPRTVAYWLENDLLVYEQNDPGAEQVAMIQIMEQQGKETDAPKVQIFATEDITMPGCEIKFLLATRGL